MVHFLHVTFLKFVNSYYILYFFTVNKEDDNNENQPGFRPGDSTTNQLLSITTSIYDSFENYKETRALFLDISKAFVKVWHGGLLFNLKCNGVEGNLLRLITCYLSQIDNNG